MPQAAEELLTPGQVAALFKVSVTTVGNWADDGKLPSFRTPGGQRRFRRSDIETFIAEQRAADDEGVA